MLVDKSGRDMIKFRNLKNLSGRVMVVLCCIVCTKVYKALLQILPIWIKKKKTKEK